jgi:hypothetical protein
MHKALNCAVTSIVIFYMYVYFFPANGKYPDQKRRLCYVRVLPTMQCHIINVCRQYSIPIVIKFELYHFSRLVG